MIESNKTFNFDTLIVTTPADYIRVRGLLHRIPENIRYGKIIFIGNSDVGKLVTEDFDPNTCKYINENDILCFDNVHKLMTIRLASIANGNDIPRKITGWYYQQFIKMAYASFCENQWYMTWDGDTIPCKNISMFHTDSGLPYFDYKSEYHAHYFDTLKLILPGISKAIGNSFISEHMLFHKDYMSEIISRIEANNIISGKYFWEKILNAIKPDVIQDAAFSEFETYGSYVSTCHIGSYRLREWHSFRYGGLYFDPTTITEDDFTWLGKDFFAISFEKNQSVRDDLKNLFNNKEYQQKLSARKMLEIAQDVSYEGYKEVWS